MSKIVLLDTLLKDYRVWTLSLKNITQDIEDNILQKDSSKVIQEKMISIGISSVLVYIVTGVFGLFGLNFGVVGCLPRKVNNFNDLFVNKIKIQHLNMI